MGILINAVCVVSMQFLFIGTAIALVDGNTVGSPWAFILMCLGAVSGVALGKLVERAKI